MKYATILSAVLTPDNAHALAPVQERLDDVRPIVLASRVVVYAALLTFGVGALIGLSTDWSVRAPKSAAVGQFVVAAAVERELEAVAHGEDTVQGLRAA